MGCVLEESEQERSVNMNKTNFIKLTKLEKNIIKLVTEYLGRKGALKIKV